MTLFTGLSAFPITPANQSGRVDTDALRTLISRLAGSGIDSIGLLGSTGTYMYLSRDERARAIESAIAEAAGRVPVIAGIGALRTDDAIALAGDAKALGAAAGLLAPVSYTLLSENEVFEHFAAVAGESGLPIVIYDNPGTTHFRFTSELIARLARLPGIVAAKNPTVTPDDSPAHLATLRAQVPPGFSVGYSGDWNCVEALIAGADAWYSVLAGMFPTVCVNLARTAREDSVEARRLNAALTPVWDLMRQHTGLRVIYALAERLGIRAEPPRPILPLAERVKQQVLDTFDALSETLDQSGVI
ncbi:dihydrodipicolinate synthase [Asticcacaulis biprosthecium C19]|uniref:Dihydrodipicolinate synthase n=1 Tax=Asticcacaulis biprosthecium C19 TaxID=715226 RepID=F4QN07_9CAUL|nr:dihydrodipicolinate synthase family protein [Asticcacaulis biprosthecium]EGF91598.1 dihydrodipicolinate synthase [Asticcacaulis biprosthecium C19]